MRLSRAVADFWSAKVVVGQRAQLTSPRYGLCIGYLSRNHSLSTDNAGPHFRCSVSAPSGLRR